MNKLLNIGCGNFPKPGYVNLDLTSPYAEVKHDLNKFPYPFKDEEFELIEADHVLEHLQDPFQVMKELYRILKPNGVLKIRVPHFSRGFTHADHKRGFDVSFPLYFDKSFHGGFVGTEFVCKKTRLTWFAQPYLKSLVIGFVPSTFGLWLGTFFDFFANLSPMFCSRLWCFWVGGFEEVYFEFVKGGE